ncbi:S-adenosyl-L-methionine-dependent methyltransferase [Ramaria rubella]|nr:S-adenosyl-L-methionine-dependent methyltransferase [Ramaria rubella]
MRQQMSRLDDRHNGIKEYLGGGLSFAPLHEGAKAILELGSGSGAWVIQAAEQFPAAEVVAVDLTPIPLRSQPLPVNLKFQAHNLTKQFPFKSETFDVVHARMTFIHLPNWEKVLSRVIELIKPGGWLLLEDVEAALYAEGGVAPNLKAYWERIHELRRERGIDAFAAVKYEKTLQASNSFSEIHVHKVTVPFSGNSGDPKLDNLAATMKKSNYRSIRLVSENLQNNISKEVAEGAQMELLDPQYNFYMNWYFTWSLKLL